MPFVDVRRSTQEPPMTTTQDLAPRENLDHADAEPSGRSLSDSLYKNRWIVLSLVLAAEVMDLVDATIVNIAAPSIRDRARRRPVDHAVVPRRVHARVRRRPGHLRPARRHLRAQPMFLTGAAGFTAASLVCGLAQSPGC